MCSLRIATLAFALACSTYFFTQPWLFGGTTRSQIARQTIAGIDLSSQRSYYYFVFAVFVIVVLFVPAPPPEWARARGDRGARDEAAAGAFGIAVARTKIIAFGVSGAIASLAAGCSAACTCSSRTARGSDRASRWTPSP